tara:strand:- start:1751 stop:2836 length:1086 start_codon:yes stop_codon:yes gene_type:complete
MEFTQDSWINLPRSDRFNKILELGLLIAAGEGLGKSPVGDYAFHKSIPHNFLSTYGRAKSVFCGGRAVRDQEMLNFIAGITPNLFEINQRIETPIDLADRTRPWLEQSSNINLAGLHGYEILAQVGTENTMKEFCLNHRTRRIRIKKGEWYYVPAILSAMNVNWAYLEDDELSKNDAIMMSVPFFSTFEIPSNYDALMEECCDKDIPVMLDFCWSLLHRAFNLDISYSCIEVCSYTIGKFFPLEQIRLGFRLVRPDYLPDFDKMYTELRLSSWLTSELIGAFPPSYIVDKYFSLQHSWKDRLGLEPTNCVMSSILPDDALWWNQHRIHGELYPQNQFSMVSLYENEDLIQEHCSWIQEGIN